MAASSSFLVARARAGWQLSRLIREEALNPQLERFFEETFLGGSLLKKKANLVALPALRRRKVEYQDKWASPQLYMPFLSSTSPVWPTKVRPGLEPGTVDASSKNPVVHVAEVLRRQYAVFKADYERIDSWYADRNVESLASSWRKFPLLSYQNWHEQAKGLQSTQILREIPEGMLAKGLGSTYFSQLQNSVHIKEHFGPTNARIRLHLGLDIPSGLYTPTGEEGLGEHTARRCYLRVADGCYHWREGEVLAFDDSFFHGVYMDGGAAEGSRAEGMPVTEGGKSSAESGKAVMRRGILVCDVYHPELTAAEKIFLEKMEAIKARCFPQIQNWKAVH